MIAKVAAELIGEKCVHLLKAHGGQRVAGLQEYLAISGEGVLIQAKGLAEEPFAAIAGDGVANTFGCHNTDPAYGFTGNI